MLWCRTDDATAGQRSVAAPMTHEARPWRLVEAGGLAGVGVMKFATIVITPAAAIFLIIDGVLFLALSGSVWRWIERPRVALAAAALGLLVLLSGIPFIAEDLSHLDSWGSFAPAAVSLVVGLAGTAAGFISFFAPGMHGSRPFAGAAGALSIALVAASVGASVGASVSASSDAVHMNDVELAAEGIEYPEVLNASAGLIGFHVNNRDPIRHTFVIEGTDVRLEVPASKERRVEVELTAGQYRFLCDVAGHERMEGVLTVR